MRILVDGRHLVHSQPSGVGEYTTQLLRALFRLDRKNEYVVLTTGTRRPSHNVWPIHVHVSTPNKLLNLSILSRQRPTMDRLAGGKIDLVFLPNLGFAAVPPEIPTVLTIHDLSWKFFPEYYSRKMRLWHKAVRPDSLISSAARIIVPSESTQDDLVRTFQKPADSISVIPHGIDPAFKSRPEARDHGVRSRHKLPKRYALFVGTLEPRKNIHAILDAMEEYRERTHDDLHLVLAGGWGWNSRDLRHRLLPTPHSLLPRWIHHLGYIPAEDRPALYRNAAVFIWPSIYEGFGLPVLEAMASGTPVITSHTSSMPEVTGSSAILIDPFNSRDISVALQELFRSPSLLEHLRVSGIERAKRFSWDQTAQKTLEVFQSSVSA